MVHTINYLRDYLHHNPQLNRVKLEQLRDNLLHALAFMDNMDRRFIRTYVVRGYLEIKIYDHGAFEEGTLIQVFKPKDPLSGNLLHEYQFEVYTIKRV